MHNLKRQMRTNLAPAFYKDEQREPKPTCIDSQEGQVISCYKVGGGPEKTEKLV